MILRTYQQAAVDAVYEHLCGKDNNPCVVIPVGGGKSLCIAQIAKDAVEKWNGRVLVLADVKRGNEYDQLPHQERFRRQGTPEGFSYSKISNNCCGWGELRHQQQSADDHCGWIQLHWE